MHTARSLATIESLRYLRAVRHPRSLTRRAGGPPLYGGARLGPSTEIVVELTDEARRGSTRFAAAEVGCGVPTRWPSPVWDLFNQHSGPTERRYPA